ncbi:MAG: hypothetical protein WCL02_05270 [bacterium]
MVAQSGLSHHVHTIPLHQRIGTSLRYNQIHSISLKYFPSLVVDVCHTQASQYPLC